MILKLLYRGIVVENSASKSRSIDDSGHYDKALIYGDKRYSKYI